MNGRQRMDSIAATRFVWCKQYCSFKRRSVIDYSLKYFAPDIRTLFRKTNWMLLSMPLFYSQPNICPLSLFSWYLSFTLLVPMNAFSITISGHFEEDCRAPYKNLRLIKGNFCGDQCRRNPSSDSWFSSSPWVNLEGSSLFGLRTSSFVCCRRCAQLWTVCQWIRDGRVVMFPAIHHCGVDCVKFRIGWWTL